MLVSARIICRLERTVEYRFLVAATAASLYKILFVIFYGKVAWKGYCNNNHEVNTDFLFILNMATDGCFAR